jgi:translation initiation factor IF-2
LATVRIYKVAELLGTTSQEVTALLKRDHGIDVKSASSTIEEVVGRQFVERLARQRGIALPTGDIFAETPVAKGKKPTTAKKAPEPPKPAAPALPPPRLVKTVKPVMPVTQAPVAEAEPHVAVEPPIAPAATTEPAAPIVEPPPMPAPIPVEVVAEAPPTEVEPRVEPVPK